MTGGVPPIRSALLQDRPASSRITREWEVFFAFLGRQAINGAGAAQYGTHAKRLTLKMGNLPDGALFAETDRTSLYELRAGQWVWIGGEMAALFADRPSAPDLGANDEGFQFRATDTDFRYRWTGAAWEEIPTVGSRVVIDGFGTGTGLEISSPGSAKVRLFRAVNGDRLDLSLNADFDGANWVRDDVTKDARLLVFTRGSSGLHYYEAPAGPNPIVLTPVFQIVAGVVRAAIKRDTLANIPSLGPADTDYLFYVTDYHHLLRWNGAGWEWAPGEDGRAGEISFFAAAPAGPGWKLCDGTGDDGNPGTAISYLKSDGTTASVVIPNLTAGAYLKAGAAYGGAVNPAIPPTTNAPVGGVPAGTTGSAAAAQAHGHVINLPGDPVPNLVILPYFRK